MLAAGLFYALALSYAHANYLNPVWEYYYFTYSPPGPAGYALILMLTSIGALWMPLRAHSASSIVLIMLYIVVYVPTIVITLGLRPLSDNPHVFLVIALCVCFTYVCVLVGSRSNANRDGMKVPSKQFEVGLVIAWIVCTIVLLASYGSIMRFAGLDEIYEQRAAASDANVLLAYTRTYYSDVFSSALIALGLTKPKKLYLALGFAGCLMTYMIAAQKTIFLLPLVIPALYVMLKSRHRFLGSTAFLVTVLSFSVIVAVRHYEDNILAFIYSGEFVLRTLAIPGSTLSEYSEVFGNDGYTWWSHVKGISLLISPPVHFASHPAWPGLGYIVGEYFHGRAEVNENANLFASDGVAAAGVFGMWAISTVLAIYLRVLDRATRGWNPRLAVLLIFPLANDLTNGPLFTVLLSFGGIFWVVFARFFTTPKAAPPTASRRPRRCGIGVLSPN